MADSDPPSTPAAAPLPPAPRTLGEMLRTARLAHDLTLEQLSTELRIEAKQLNALEENRFEQIGVPVFVKGYLKQYGQRLGVDVGDLLALYYKQTTLADIQVQPSRTIKLRDERQITSWIIAGVVLLLVIAGLGVWWWNGGDFGAMPLTGSTPASTSAPPAVEPAARTPSQAVEQSAAPSPAPAAPPADAPQAPATDAPVSSNTAPGAVPAAAIAEAAAADDDRAAPIVAIPLEFTFEEESWAEVTDARGERLVFGLNAAGRRITVRGEPPFAIVLGNADAVRLTVDGEPYTIPATRQRDDLARFSVDIAEE